MANITLVLKNLKIGGVQKITIDLAKSLIEAGHNVRLFSLSRACEFCNIDDLEIFYPIKTLGRLGKYISFSRCASWSDVVITSLPEYWPLRFSTAFRYKSIAWLHGPAEKVGIQKLKNNIKKINKIICVSNGIKIDLINLFPNAENKIIDIPNFVDAYALSQLAREYNTKTGSTEKRLLCVQRFSSQKDHKTLIKAIHLLRQKNIQINLTIVGDGDTRPDAENIAKALKVDDLITFAGSKSNPYPYFLDADAFVLSSYFEGFGIVLIESLAFALPTISTNCEFGPAEILGNGEYGILTEVGDEKQMADAIHQALFDEQTRTKLISASTKRAAIYDRKTITEKWENLFR